MLTFKKSSQFFCLCETGIEEAVKLIKKFGVKP